MTSWKLKQEEKTLPKKVRGGPSSHKHKAQQQTEKELDEEAREIMNDINVARIGGETSGNNG
jgi:hypothetical protein